MSLKDPAADGAQRADAAAPHEPGERGDAGGDRPPVGVDASSLDARRDELGRHRVRLMDLPSTWFVSPSRVYAVDDATRLRSVRPRREYSANYTFQLQAWSKIAATDDVVIHRGGAPGDSQLTLYAADEPNHVLATVPSKGWDDPVVVGERFAFVKVTGAEARNLYLWPPSSSEPELALSFTTAAALVAQRARGSTLLFSEVTGTTLWVLDTQAKSATSVSLHRAPWRVDRMGEAFLVESLSGNGRVFELIEDNGPPRDLSAEIFAATADIPVEDRRAIGGIESFDLYGDWLIYSAVGGILAFDVVGGRLAPCQLRNLADGIYSSPRVLTKEGDLVFERRAGATEDASAQGLYVIALSDVLPP